MIYSEPGTTATPRCVVPGGGLLRGTQAMQRENSSSFARSMGGGRTSAVLTGGCWSALGVQPVRAAEARGGGCTRGTRGRGNRGTLLHGQAHGRGVREVMKLDHVCLLEDSAPRAEPERLAHDDRGARLEQDRSRAALGQRTQQVRLGPHELRADVPGDLA